ncbi:MAG: phosphate/phosphite/phosphonate ABC transporter substrate-binding protein [Acetobacteraceae bacterium]|jgi:phosphonate transport system substrate-binding protein|nr:phosphate/phosphite/phosphonate ABC transporter substrate-binding protein [Acetobacteraceae bacterium]
MRNALGRRITLAAPLLLLPAAAKAQAAWRGQHRELRMSLISSENERDALVRYEAFSAYMQRSLGVPFRVFRATDYAGAVEALRSNQVEFSRLGPASYALARKVMGERVTAIARDRDESGAEGYYSVIVVRADSPVRSLADLRGKSLAWADPNSTSGFAFPNYFLRKEGVDIERFFARTGFAGNHEMGVLAVINGSYDAAATFWTNERRGNVPRMVEKGMVPAGAVRNVWQSPLIPNSPFVTRTDLPRELQEAFRDALLTMHERDPEALRALASSTPRLAAAKHEDYLDVIAVTEENEARRRQRRS